MKKVGHETLRIHSDDEYPRNGEGSFARLDNGSIIYVYNAFNSGSVSDHAGAVLRAVISEDEGDTWTAPRTLFPIDKGAQNNMSPCVFRMRSGKLGLVYSRKEKFANGSIECMPVFRASADGGLSWDDWRFCTETHGYYCTINGGVTVLNSGRIIVPASYSGPSALTYPAVCVYLYSDNDGATWKQLPGTAVSPYGDHAGLMEPGIFELTDGRLWTWFRTLYGYQYESFSENGGKTWTEPKPNFFFSSPDSPMRIARAGDCVLSVYNPVPYNILLNKTESWGAPKRTPLVFTRCGNGGLSFIAENGVPSPRELEDHAGRTFLLEDDIANSYCYPSLQETSDGFLAAYYHSADTGICLRDLRISKVFRNEYM